MEEYKKSEWKEFEDFYEAHNLQLYGMKFPRNLAEKLYYKLKYEIFDSTRFFEIIDNQLEERLILRAKIPLKKEIEIFLIDHFWTFKIRQLNDEFFKTYPNVIDRTFNILKYADIRRNITTIKNTEKSSSNFYPSSYLDLDNKNIENFENLNLENNIKALSLEDNKIKNFDLLVDFMKSKGENLKAIWLEGNPFEITNECYFDLLVDTFSNLELINRKFTKNATEWSLEFIKTKYVDKKFTKYLELYGNNDNKKSDSILYMDLEGRDPFAVENLDIFSTLGKTCRFLDLRNNSYDFSFSENSKSLFDLLSYFPNISTLFIDETEDDFLTKNEEEKDEENGNENIFTLFKFLRYKKNLDLVLTICQKLKYINDHQVHNFHNMNILTYKEHWMRKYMWKKAQTYRLVTQEKYDEDSTWYINDEIGSSINHSDKPNVALFPFIFSPSNTFKDDMITYSILWPLEEINEKDEILRDFLSNITEEQQRSARLTCWFNTPRDYFVKKFEERIEQFNKFNTYKKIDKVDIVTEIDRDRTDSLPNYLVFSDLEYVRANLNSPNFEITNDITTADIIWLNTDYFKVAENYSLKPKCYKNQFPYENIITMKSHLAYLIQSNSGLNSFFNISYNMETNLGELIGNYIYNSENNINNSWIIKPINMARSMDMIITDNLDEIIRNVETGPKICQKYIDRPLLLNDKKFDLRFIVLLKRLVPLELYFYSKMFWVRSANKPFTMDSSSFTDYEVHFTVMNYNTFGMQTIYDKQFLEYLNLNNIDWQPIYNKIKIAVKSIFEIAAYDKPEMNDPYSRAIYGLDIMIDNDLNPKILEINYSPDCTRACKFIPEFFDDIFSTLFLDCPSGVELV